EEDQGAGRSRPGPPRHRGGRGGGRPHGRGRLEEVERHVELLPNPYRRIPDRGRHRGGYGRFRTVPEPARPLPVLPLRRTVGTDAARLRASGGRKGELRLMNATARDLPGADALNETVAYEHDNGHGQDSHDDAGRDRPTGLPDMPTPTPQGQTRYT